MPNLAWTPVGWRVVVDPEYAKELDWGLGQTFSIVQPDRTGIAAVTKGKVVALGNACYKEPRYHGVWCEVGDVVVYARHGGIIIEDPDTKKKYVVLNDEDIIGRYNE